MNKQTKDILAKLENGSKISNEECLHLMQAAIKKLDYISELTTKFWQDALEGISKESSRAA